MATLDKYKYGDPCERKKPCKGSIRLYREFGPVGWPTKWLVFRCDQCGKKHLTKTKRNA